MDGLLLICVVLGVLFVYIVLLGNRSKIPHPKKEAENTGFSFDAIPGASSGPKEIFQRFPKWVDCYPS